MSHEELSQDQITQFLLQLDRLEAELEGELVKTDAEAGPVDLGIPIGRLSRMDAIQQQKMAQATREQQRLRLTKVRQARDAIARGEYGMCRVCEETIDPRRLEVRPESLICLPCQSTRESASARRG